MSIFVFKACCLLSSIVWKTKHSFILSIRILDCQTLLCFLGANHLDKKDIIEFKTVFNNANVIIESRCEGFSICIRE